MVIRVTLALSDRVMMFGHGQAVEQVPPEQICGAPQHPRTRSFRIV
jgi:ABC-type glutathione transport system ATPase component